jgi:hypothetical protein
LSDLTPELARSFEPAGLPAILLFLMLRFNDLTVNGEGILTVMTRVDSVVSEAAYKNRRSRIEVTA